MDAEQGQRGIRSLLVWVKAHPLRSLLILLAAWLAFEIGTLPYAAIDELKTKNPTETAFMREHRERAEAGGKPFHIRHRWVPLSRIPQDAVSAVIVAEDGTFWSHDGFDWYELRESVERNIAEGRAARGASTISQQLVKNLFLSSSKNPLRKLKEWILTWKLERTLSKSRILEIYLNVIEWGNGIYGIEAAARSFFGKGATELTREECARLAAVIPSPRRHRADSDSRYVMRRTRMILERMRSRRL